MAEIRSGASYHPAALTLAAHWAYRGVSFRTSSRRLQRLFDETPEAARDARWITRRGELFALLNWVFRREGEKSAPGPGGAEVIDIGLLRAEVAKLAKLGAPEYEGKRKAAAAQIKIATNRLDALVKNERSAHADDDDLSGRAVAFPRDVPWPEEVELTDLLDAIDAVLQETMVMTDAQRLGFGLWVVFSHVLDAFDHSPRLIIRSALKRSGKSKLLRLARLLVARGLSVVGISPAALFRAIEAFRPTLLMDESDLYLNDARKGAGAELNTALQALVNGGFDRDDSQVVRVEGERVRKPRLFSIWCAMGLARIGVAASTIEDRSVVIILTRKATSEKVARLDKALRARIVGLRRQIARWAADHGDALGKADPDLPEFGSDRAADAWRPLIAIADLGGKALGAQARAAALALVREQEAGTQEIELQALADIAPWLADHPQLQEVFTSELVAHLVTLEHRPWPEYGRRQQPISQSQLARLLSRIDLASVPVWRKAPLPGGKPVSARGYSRARLERVIAHYFPSSPPFSSDPSKAS
jgi:putative DNA primase/helicase